MKLYLLKPLTVPNFKIYCPTNSVNFINILEEGYKGIFGIMINKDLPEKKEAKDREDQVINRAHIK